MRYPEILFPRTGAAAHCFRYVHLSATPIERRAVPASGGPQFKFDEAVSFQINCETQDEVDHYWERLSEGGEEGPCGWLKDRYGLSWQVVPTGMEELFADPDPGRAQRAMEAMLKMGKLDIAALRSAADGVPSA